jgi:hypothetical protein
MTNSSPVVDSNISYTMVKLSSGANSTVPSSGTGQLTSGYGYSTGDFPTHYYPWKPYTYPTGYTCPGCGAWVYYGNYHNCYPKTVISYPVYIQQPVDLTPLLEKLDELTEEIKKLRKQTKKALDK